MEARQRLLNKVTSNRELEKKHLRIYAILSNCGPMTGEQLKRRCKLNFYSETVRNRLTELKKLGMVIVIGKTISEVSGRKISVFDITDRVHPMDIDLKESQLKKLKSALKEVISKGQTKKFRELIKGITL